MSNTRDPSPTSTSPTSAEFPPLRRMKPLPKRRRTSPGTTNRPDYHIRLNHQQSSGGITTASFTAHGAAASALIQQGLGVLQQHQQHHGQSALEMLASATTGGLSLDGFLNGTEPLSLSARMALQNYYTGMPILGTVQSLLAANAAVMTTGTGTVPVAEPNSSSNVNTTANNAAAAAAAATLAAITSAGTGSGGQLPVSLADFDTIEFGVHFAAAAAAAAAAALGGLGGMGYGFPGMNMNMGQVPTSMPMPVGSHARDDSDPRGDADYLDHMQQPGNTKKRKVPANVGGSPRGGPGRGEGGDDGESLGTYFNDGHDDDQGGEHVGRDGDGDVYEYDAPDRPTSDSMSPTTTSYPPPPFPGQISLVVKKRGKMTAVTLAGLQHKEMLKSRKRQLTAVMGALSHGDTLALDQALSASFPSLSGLGSALSGGGSGMGEEEERGPRLCKSKRLSVRLARAMKALLETPERRIPHPDAVPFPSTRFDFVCTSETAERLIATKAEVNSLRNQFERELERQASKAAKMVTRAAGGNKAMARAGGGKAKRERMERERVARVEKTHGQKAKVEVTTSTTSKTGTQDVTDSPAVAVPPIPSLSGGGKSKAKKKKRSALANASNPHHLRNYVPSRLPNSGPVAPDRGNAPGAQNADLIWPLPIRFLSADIPPRRRSGQGHEDEQFGKKPRPVTNAPLGGSLMQPTEEWICAFCEYDLFYGSDAAYRKGVRNRKKILKRRRRARERAAAAASGAKMAAAKGAAAPVEQDEQDFDEYEDDEGGVEEYGNAPAQDVGRVKAGPDKDG